MIPERTSFQDMGAFLQLDGEPVRDSRPSPVKHSPWVWLLRAFLLSVMVVLLVGVLVPDPSLDPDLVEPTRENLAIIGIDTGSGTIIPANKTTGNPDGNRMYPVLIVDVRITNDGDEYVDVKGILLETTVTGPNNVSVEEVVCRREHLGPGESMVLTTYHNPNGLTSKETMPVVVRISYQSQLLDAASGAAIYEIPVPYRFTAGPDPRA